MKKVLNIIYYIIFIVIILIGLMLIVSVFPIKGNIQVLSVLSGSMEPEIHTGSVVVIKPVGSYKVGDVITFGKNTKTEIPTTHRVAETRVESGEMVYKTKGDANDSPDGKEVLEKEVLGKVFFSIPYLGYVVDFVRKPFGLMLVIIIPAVVIIYDQIQKIIKEIKKLNLKVKKVEEEVEEIEEKENEENK